MFVCMQPNIKSLAFLLFITLFTFSCSEETPKTPENTDSKYKGDWSGTFQGDDDGTWQIAVDKDGKLSGSLFSQNVQTNYPIDSGTISSTGVFNAYITINGVHIDFDGNANSEDSASGTWGNPALMITGTRSGSKK